MAAGYLKCPPVFPNRSALWTDHLFEPFLEWVNESLANAKRLALYGSSDYATWAGLLRDDLPSQALPGGGFALNFSAWVEGRTRREKPEAAPILLPCRACRIRRTEHGGRMKRSIRPPSSVSPSSRPLRHNRTLEAQPPVDCRWKNPRPEPCYGVLHDMILAKLFESVRTVRSAGATQLVIGAHVANSIHIHHEFAEKLLADGVEGARAVAALSRQAIRVVQACGLAYAPIALPNGTGCAMSARGGARGLIVEIDPSGTTIPGRGVVREMQPERKPEGLEQAQRLRTTASGIKGRHIQRSLHMPA